MIPVKYWDIWTWLMLIATALNAYFFVTTGGILSLIFGIVCGTAFHRNVKT
jgi:hypothetical protein